MTGVPAALAARLVVERGGFRLDAELNVAPGEVLALLGPNGAGKSTALRALAGLAPMADGRILLDGADLTTAPTEDRPIGMVFQDYLLFDHLSALDNVAFGPRCQGASRAGARARAAELLERVGLADHARARPRALSGGQAQRVALARALAVRPRLLLLDEPLAALDAHTRASVRSRLRRHLADFDGAAVIVTHDPLDAMVLADRVTVIEEGAVVQDGPPADVARHPRTGYVARLVGLNLYRGEADGTRVEVVGAAGAPARIAVAEPCEGEVFVAFPPRAVALYRERPDGTPRNVWELVIDGIERFGDQVRVHLDGDVALSADITPAGLAELGAGSGERVWASVKATETRCYPA
ncbi:molybdate transport system ATP-binding protein [Spinactinospora alkalitolerans]|uniref:Molybdate transport system ATP-binding protein n=1 Tax=Spinactinospora alkalitolerans TaxID=687207 RepID=A0A852TPS0_9ACTN|nr:ABC transporter ATP-binding protein [Spinactinospora alkalitolerans]NYE45277.1 molybdate transport system ATP-binding protein [Spinactinospora alkalitolerans]